MEGVQGEWLDERNSSLPFPPCFPDVVFDFETLALWEAPGFRDLLILLLPSFPFQRYSISEKLPYSKPRVALSQDLCTYAFDS